MTLAEYLLPILIALRPAGHATDSRCAESAEDYSARVQSHIIAAQGVAFDTHERQAFTGPWAREKALVQVLAIAQHESFGFCKAVDEGTMRGDSGASGCAMGLMSHLGMVDGHPFADVLHDLHLCYAIGYRRMRSSLQTCSGDAGLAVYASGSCGKGRKESREMLNLGRLWWGRALFAWQNGEWELE